MRLTGATHSPSAQQSAYIADGLGSVIGLVNGGSLAASQRFDAWGKVVAASGAVPAFGYTGREPDATGLVYYRARYYHPEIGRFISRDPMGMVDAVSRYAYVRNSPVDRVDPFGRKAQLVTPADQNAYPQTVQVAVCVPCMQAATTMTDATAGVIGSVGNQSLNGGRGTGSNVDVLAPQKDSARGQIAGKPSSWTDTVSILTTPALLGLRLVEWIVHQVQGASSDPNTYAKPPENARDPNGPKAPGKPPAEVGFSDPKGGENWVPNPNPGKGGGSHGWQDANGDVWVPSGQGGRAHGGPHWDVQTPGGGYRNVRPPRP